MNRLKAEADELRSKVSQAEERVRIGSASEEGRVGYKKTINYFILLFSQPFECR